MVNFVVTNPPPEVFGAMRAGDVDSRARDWSGDLVPDGDTVSSVVAVQIARRDNVAMGGSDLTWVPPATIDTTKQITTIGLRNGLPGVVYVVGIQVTTTLGRTLTRDAYVTVTAALG